jgi:hypothetical protein
MLYAGIERYLRVPLAGIIPKSARIVIDAEIKLA